MADERETSQDTNKNKAISLVVIFGVVAFLVSGICTGNVAWQISSVSSPNIYSPPTVWAAIQFGAFGFIPAALFIGLGWWVGKHGHKTWIDLLLLLLGVYLVFVILFSFFVVDAY